MCIRDSGRSGSTGARAARSTRRPRRTSRAGGTRRSSRRVGGVSPSRAAAARGRSTSGETAAFTYFRVLLLPFAVSGVSEEGRASGSARVPRGISAVSVSRVSRSTYVAPSFSTTTYFVHETTLISVRGVFYFPSSTSTNAFSRISARQAPRAAPRRAPVTVAVARAAATPSPASRRHRRRNV